MYLRPRSLDIVEMIRKEFFFRQVSDQILLVENSDQILLAVENLEKEQLIPHDFTVVPFFCGTHQLRVVALPPLPLQEAHFVSSSFYCKVKYLLCKDL